MKENININVYPHGTWLKYFKWFWSQITQPFKITSLNNTADSITMDELMTVFKSLKSNEAPGEDSVKLELLKHASQEFLNQQLKFFNIIWEREQPPEDWKNGTVISIYEKGALNNCENYREISLLISSYKMYANIIKNK